MIMLSKRSFFLSLFPSVGYNRLASSQQKCEEEEEEEEEEGEGHPPTNQARKQNETQEGTGSAQPSNLPPPPIPKKCPMAGKWNDLLPLAPTQTHSEAV